MNRLGPLFARAFIKQWHPLLYNSRHDPDSVDDAVRKVYEEPLQVQNWDEELWMLIKNASGTLTPQQLGELSQPVLVVHGQSDTLVSLEESQNLYEIIPGAEWLLIPNSGHLPQEETPQALSTGILSFLEKKK
jgi:pimeloyl-ACP methyl ester carboxylesterase